MRKGKRGRIELKDGNYLSYDLDSGLSLKSCKKLSRLKILINPTGKREQIKLRDGSYIGYDLNVKEKLLKIIKKTFY